MITFLLAIHIQIKIDKDLSFFQYDFEKNNDLFLKFDFNLQFFVRYIYISSKFKI